VKFKSNDVSIYTIDTSLHFNPRRKRRKGIFPGLKQLNEHMAREMNEGENVLLLMLCLINNGRPACKKITLIITVL
jgi:hypothetical protein